MNYHSTRDRLARTSLSAALAAGLAPDGGLYVPESLPHLQPEEFADAKDLPQVAARLLAPFFAHDPLADALAAVCDEALDLPAPLVPLAGRRSFVLQLFHGPTAAFKDFGARFLAACMARLPDATQATRTVLVATSGDTGAAVAAAFHRRPGFRVVILYPDGKVSPRQAHQLGCFGDNVQALRVDGRFDDCQRLVKQALADRELAARMHLTSANSISLGRLLPQMSYYALAALQHGRASGRKLGFVVPTGNLGNALACLLARDCGLPVGPIVLANNNNRVLADFFAGNDYAPRNSVATLANAMDVGTPSNFERLRWWYPDAEHLRRQLRADWVDAGDIRDTITRWQRDHDVVLCPHTACAARVLERRRTAGDNAEYAIVATAHPAKFDSVVEPLIGQPVPVPPALQALLDRPAHAEPMAADYDAFRRALRAAGSVAGAP